MNRRDLLKTCSLAAAAAPAEAEDGRPPNFVVIMTDDAGYGDYSCCGHPTILSPNVDRMASEGMRFTQYIGSPLCGPSRGQLLTGRLGVRTGLTTNLFPWSEGGIPDSEITIAQMLKKANYQTMCVGKWHLGSRVQYLPTRHGFDDYFGIPYSNDMSKKNNPRAEWADRCPPLPLMRGEKVIEEEPDQSLLTRRYTGMATDFIRKSSRAGKPFFLYLPHTMPHFPFAASDRFRGKSRAGLYGDVMEEIDWSAGEILRTLREQNVDRNTLVLLTSDNGPESGSAGPLRDGKVTTWEGGVREPCIVRWPGRIPAGIVTDAFATEMDLLPTFLKLAGLTMPADRTYDGQDLSPVLFHNDPGREPQFFYYRNSPGGPYDREEKLMAVRKGRWKLHTSVAYRHTPPYPGEGDPPLLYDVQGDVSERRNVVKRRPDVVKQLLALMEEHRTSFTPAPTQR